MARIFWTTQEIEILKELYPNNTVKSIAKRLNRQEGSVRGKAGELNLKKAPEWKNNPENGCFKKGHRYGSSTMFKKGHTSHNKGKKQSDYMSAEAIAKSKATTFKKGHKPKNTKYDGYITQRWHKGDNCFYKYIRISNANWKQLSHKIWEDHNGPMPKGGVIRFRDRNSLNVVIENLELIDKKTNMKRNSIHEIYPEDIKQTILKLGHLKRIINGKKQNN